MSIENPSLGEIQEEADALGERMKARRNYDAQVGRRVARRALAGFAGLSVLLFSGYEINKALDRTEAVNSGGNTADFIKKGREANDTPSAVRALGTPDRPLAGAGSKQD